MNGAELPHVSLCLATSLDGKISEQAGSAPAFTSRYDRDKLFRLRAEAQALLIGANTVRQETLPPLVRKQAFREARLKRGWGEHPDVVLVSGSMKLPWENSYFSEAKQKISVLTGQAGAEAKQAATEAGVQIIETGSPLDLAKGLRKLKALGYDNILCEGGGRLVHSVLAADLADRLYLTLAPTFIGGRETPSLVNGEVLKPRADFELVTIDQVGSECHLVYTRPGGAASHHQHFD